MLLHHNLSSASVKLSRSVCFFTCAAGADEQSFPPSATSADAESTGKRWSQMGKGGRRECREGRRVGSELGSGQVHGVGFEVGLALGFFVGADDGDGDG